MTDQAVNVYNRYAEAHLARPLGLKQMEEFVHHVNVANGWYESSRTFGDDIALLHSEVSEALEAFRNWQEKDATAAPTEEKPIPKPEGVGSELADVLVRLLDTCWRYNINLQSEFMRKMQYNATRGSTESWRRSLVPGLLDSLHDEAAYDKFLTPDEENEVRTEHRRVCQCGGSLCGYEERAVSVVERILAARLAPVWKIPMESRTL